MNIPLSPGTKVRLYKQPVDLRVKAYRLQALIGISDGGMQKGTYYMFVNKPRTLINVLWFDGSGMCVLSKHLEEGNFSWPQSAQNDCSKWMGIEAVAAVLLMEGVELEKCCKKAWYEA